jgi:hypothetical protein
MKNYDDIICEYFEYSLTFEGDKPKFKIKLLEKYKTGSTTPFRPGTRTPYSGVQKEYYTHYLGNKGINVWEARKTLCSVFDGWLDFCKRVMKLNDTDISNLDKYQSSISSKIKEKLNTHYSSPNAILTKEKYKKRTEKWSKVIGRMNSDKWSDESWKMEEMKRRNESGFYIEVAEKNKLRMGNPDYKKMFLEAVNDPKRIKKISESSKKMWQRFKETHPDEMYNIVNSGAKKNFELNGYKMNSIEFIIGSLLNSLSIKWEYNKCFTFGKSLYSADFYIPEHNTVVECYGDFWHASPRLFSDGDVIFRKKSVNEIRKKNEKRKKDFVDNDINFLYYWEYDIKNNLETIKKDICQSILKKK